MAKPKIKFVPESLHVKSGDLVYVISGKDKGKTGKVTKVLLFDEKAGKPTRVKYEVRDGKKVRISKKSGEIL